MIAPSPLTRFVQEIERVTNLRAPMQAEDLAMVLGLDVHEVPGARFALRLRPATGGGGGNITIDGDTLPVVRELLIAGACARYLLRRSGKLHTTGLNAADIAGALCGVSALALHA